MPRVDPPAWDILLPYSIGRKVCPMNLIPCTDPCIYQRDGRCTLPRAGSSGAPQEAMDASIFFPDSRPHSRTARAWRMFRTGINCSPSGGTMLSLPWRWGTKHLVKPKRRTSDSR